MKNYLDLFSGIGGFALGAHWANLSFDNHYFSEVDPYAVKIYKQRFPDAINLGDIRNIKGIDLPTGEWLLSGGFPCQDISIAGKGAGLAGERSRLWYEYARLIEELRPKAVVIENVGALVRRGLGSVLESLAEIGYDAEWQDIRASDVGAPHRRERLWIVAYPNSTGLQAPGSEQQTTRTPRTRETMADSDEIMRNGRRGAWEWWATEPDVGRVAHGVPARVDRLKCLGNSIVPQIAQLIFEQPFFDGWRL